jgi:transporter family-2 protein
MLSVQPEPMPSAAYLRDTKQEMQMLWIAIVIALAAGAGNPLQAGANAELNHVTGHPLLAALWVYLSGLAGVLLLVVLMLPFFPVTFDRLAGSAAQVPWWAWMGGVISIGSTIAGLMLAQRLGSGVFTGLSVTAACWINLDGRASGSTRPRRCVCWAVPFWSQVCGWWPGPEGCFSAAVVHRRVRTALLYYGSSPLLPHALSPAP